MPGRKQPGEGTLSRREFARGVALAAATVGVPLTARGVESASAVQPLFQQHSDWHRKRPPIG
jgi:hypothetical protein